MKLLAIEKERIDSIVGNEDISKKRLDDCQTTKWKRLLLLYLEMKMVQGNQKWIVAEMMKQKQEETSERELLIGKNTYKSKNAFLNLRKCFSEHFFIYKDQLAFENSGAIIRDQYLYVFKKRCHTVK